jgi:hypothetical protein
VAETQQTSEAFDPRVSAEQERLLERVNDPTALNGGSARHWYAPNRTERTPTRRQRSKLIVAVILWGTVALGAVLLVSMI